MSTVSKAYSDKLGTWIKVRKLVHEIDDENLKRIITEVTGSLGGSRELLQLLFESMETLSYDHLKSIQSTLQREIYRQQSQVSVPPQNSPPNHAQISSLPSQPLSLQAPPDASESVTESPKAEEEEEEADEAEEEEEEEEEDDDGDGDGDDVQGSGKDEDGDVQMVDVSREDSTKDIVELSPPENTGTPPRSVVPLWARRRPKRKRKAPPLASPPFLSRVRNHAATRTTHHKNTATATRGRQIIDLTHVPSHVSFSTHKQKKKKRIRKRHFRPARRLLSASNSKKPIKRKKGSKIKIQISPLFNSSTSEDDPIRGGGGGGKDDEDSISFFSDDSSLSSSLGRREPRHSMRKSSSPPPSSMIVEASATHQNSLASTSRTQRAPLSFFKINKLPQPLISFILSYLKFAELLHFEKVCSRFCFIARLPTSCISLSDKYATKLCETLGEREQYLLEGGWVGSIDKSIKLRYRHLERTVGERHMSSNMGR